MLNINRKQARSPDLAGKGALSSGLFRWPGWEVSWAWVLTPVVSELRSLLAESTSEAVLLNL